MNKISSVQRVGWITKIIIKTIKLWNDHDEDRLHCALGAVHTSEWHCWMPSELQQSRWRHIRVEVVERYDWGCFRCWARKPQPILHPDLPELPESNEHTHTHTENTTKTKTAFTLLIFFSSSEKKPQVKIPLTTELAHGKNIPRQNRPRIGPPTMPKIFKAICSSNMVNNQCKLLKYAEYYRIPHGVSLPVKLNHPWSGWDRPWPDTAAHRTSLIKETQI